MTSDSQPEPAPGDELRWQTLLRASDVDVPPPDMALLAALRQRSGDWLVEVRRCGVVMGLRFADPRGAMLMAKHLYDAGIWAMFAGFDPSVLQFKAGLLVGATYCDEALSRFEDGMRRCLAAR